MNPQDYLKNPAFIGGAVAVLAAVLSMLGVTDAFLSAEAQQALVENILAAMSAVGAIVAYWFKRPE